MTELSRVVCVSSVGLHPAERNAVCLTLGAHYLRNSPTLHTVIRKWHRVRRSPRIVGRLEGSAGGVSMDPLRSRHPRANGRMFMGETSVRERGWEGEKGRKSCQAAAMANVTPSEGQGRGWVGAF